MPLSAGSEPTNSLLDCDYLKNGYEKVSRQLQHHLNNYNQILKHIWIDVDKPLNHTYVCMRPVQCVHVHSIYTYVVCAQYWYLSRDDTI